MESMIMIVAMLAMLYFFMIRPENKRKKEAQNMRDSLTVGDVIESGVDRVRIELTKWAVSSKTAQAEEAAH